MDLSIYRDLRSQARRLARSDADAEDLLQSALLAAVEAGRDDPAWLFGAMRNLAKMQARTAIRRRRREAATAEHDEAVGSERNAELERPTVAALFDRLPPAARRVAVLALHGLNAEEIRWILGLSATSFRQRLTTIRKTIGALPPEQRGEALALAYVRDSARSVDLQFGLIRRALKAALNHGPGLGTHDADGHLIVVRGRAHTSAPSGNDEVPTQTEESSDVERS